MVCRITDLRYKEVVNITDGSCLGCVSDVDIDTQCARVVALVIFGRPRLFGLLGREEDIIIPWDQIECIGEDTVLVRFHCAAGPRGFRRRESILDRIFG